MTHTTDPLSEGETLAWRQLAEQGQKHLSTAVFEVGAGEGRWLAEEASGIASAQWHLKSHEPATRRGVAAFDAMMLRRLSGEPIQYVLRSWPFRSLDLLVDRRVLIPRPETEVLVDLAVAELGAMETSAPVVVDLGTGSGAIALSIAVEAPAALVMATDVSADALAVARANLAGTGTAAAAVSIHQGSWFEALPQHLGGTLDLVLSNPPYISETDYLPDSVRAWEPEIALLAGPRGIECVEQILIQSRQWLGPQGTVILEMSREQTAVAVEVARSCGYGMVRVEKDLTRTPRFIVASIR